MSRHEKRGLGVPISMDYCFFGGEEHIEEEEQPGSLKVLVLHDDSIDAVWALQVERKGVSDEVVSWVMQKLEETGHNGP